MSLIADALKAAQDEKRKKHAPPRARAGGAGYFPLRGGGRAARRLSLPLVGAVGILFPVVLATVFLWSRRGGPQPARPAFSQSAAPYPSAIDSSLVDTAMSASSDAGPVPEDDAPETTVAVEADDGPAPTPRRRAPVPRRDAPSVADASRPALTVAQVSSRDASARMPTGLQILMDRSGTGSADALFQQALAAQRSGDHVRARDSYLRVIAVAPTHAEAHNNLGAVYRALGDMESAELAYRQAVAADPRFAPAWSNLGALLGRLGRPREAIEALVRASQIEPDNVGAKVNLAIQYNASGLTAEARRLLDDVLRADPTHAEAHYTLAQVLERDGDRERARRHYQLFLSTAAGRFPQQEEQVRRRLQAMGS